MERMDFATRRHLEISAGVRQLTTPEEHSRQEQDAYDADLRTAIREDRQRAVALSQETAHLDRVKSSGKQMAALTPRPDKGVPSGVQTQPECGSSRKGRGAFAGKGEARTLAPRAVQEVGQGNRHRGAS